MSRARDQKRLHGATVTLADDGIVRGPALPTDAPWHPQTIAWYETWRRSPMAQLWTETDWDFLLDTAVLHTKFWTTGRFDVGAELRQRVSKLGATIEDRVRLKVSIETNHLSSVPDAEPEAPKAIDEYRKRIGVA